MWVLVGVPIVPFISCYQTSVGVGMVFRFGINIVTFTFSCNIVLVLIAHFIDEKLIAIRF